MNSYSWAKIQICDLPLASLTGADCLVYLALVSVMSENFKASASYSSLCRSLRISKRTAYRAIAHLESLDLIHRYNGQGQILSVLIKRGAAVGRAVFPSQFCNADRERLFVLPGANSV